MDASRLTRLAGIAAALPLAGLTAAFGQAGAPSVRALLDSPVHVAIAPIAAPPECGIRQSDLLAPMQALARQLEPSARPVATATTPAGVLSLGVVLTPLPKQAGCSYDIALSFASSPRATAEQDAPATAPRWYRASIGLLPAVDPAAHLRARIEATGKQLIAEWREAQQIVPL